MALKNLFDMVKADRYTADGREAIIKAQEAETEDATRRTYQIGEISQATGLQKTANGWVKPKNGKQPGAASKHDTDPQTYIVKKNDELRKMYLNEKDPAKKEAMKKALKKQASMMEPEPFSSTESKSAAQEVKLGGGADTYYFEDPDNMSNEDKVFKSLGIELAETFGDHDGDPGNVETWANAWLDNTQNEGGLGIKSKKTRQPAAPVSADEVMRIVEENPARWNRIIGNAKKFYEGKGSSTDFESDESYPIKLVGGKTKPSAQYYAEGKRNKKNNPLTGSDSAPRVLTGDCRIRIRKEKPALTGDTKIRVRK